MDRHAAEKGAAFCSVLSIVIALVGCISLWGVEPLFETGRASSAQVLVRAAGLALCALNLPLWLPLRRRSTGRLETLSWQYPAKHGLAVLALALGGAASWALSVPLWWIPMAAGVPAAVLTFRASARSSSLQELVTLAVLSVVFGLWTASMAWGSSFLTPLYELKLVLGTTHIDTLHHATYANMLGTYGVPSTGMDGVPYIPYNIGTHVLFLLLAQLVDAHILAFYNLGYPVIFLPVLYLALIGLGLSVRRAFYATLSRTRDSDRNRQFDWPFWLVLLSGFIGILPQALALQMGVWNNIMRGESFSVAMCALCFLLSTMFLSAEDLFEKPGALPPAALRSWARYYAPLGVALVGFIKITVMIAALPALGYVFLRLKLYRAPIFRAVAVLITLLSALVYLTTHGGTAGGAETAKLSLFNFFRTYVRGDLKLYSPIFYFFWVWLLIGLRLYGAGVRSLGDIRDQVVADRFIDIELIVVLCAGSCLPGILLALPAGAANYFSEVHNWVALAFVMACAWPILRLDRI